MAYSKRPAPGQATSANSEPVVIASDQSAVPVSFTGSTDVATQATLALIKAKTDNLDKAVSAVNKAHSVSVGITCPANVTAYAANDAIGDVGGSAIVTFTNVGVAGAPVIIKGLSIRYDSGTLPTANGNITARIYNAAPTAIADNAAWDLVSGDRTKFLTSISIGTLADLGSTCFVNLNSINEQVLLTSANLYVVFTTDAAITRAENSTPITFTLHTIEL